MKKMFTQNTIDNIILYNNCYEKLLYINFNNLLCYLNE